jgi:hypothetical protein
MGFTDLHQDTYCIPYTYTDTSYPGPDARNCDYPLTQSHLMRFDWPRRMTLSLARILAFPGGSLATHPKYLRFRAGLDCTERRPVIHSKLVGDMHLRLTLFSLWASDDLNFSQEGLSFFNQSPALRLWLMHIIYD